MKLSEIDQATLDDSRASFNIPETLDPSSFRDTTDDLTPEQRLTVIDQALFLMEEIYVHLPLKRAMHAIDPVQALKLLRRKVETLSERQFHNAMIDIFKRLRDLHTNYVLPSSYQGRIAFLPFLMEEYYDNQGVRHYIVSRMLVGFSHPEFGPGAEILKWSGAPIDIAVAEVADQEAGSNEPARHVRGLDAMTIRPLATTLPPTEEWIIVTYDTGDGTPRELRLPWQILLPGGNVIDIAGAGGALDAARTGSHPPYADAMGFDLTMELTNRAKALLFVEGSQERRARGNALREQGTGGDARLESLLGATSFFPDTFEFREVTVDSRAIGYLRIRTFGEPNPDQFIAEVVRILGLLPQDGLIIDVRGNGGGIILNGERMLQLFTPNRVEAERLHFINNSVTEAIAASDALGGFARQWEKSIRQSVVTGAIYSQGFPIEDPEDTNAIGQVYSGPVVLITDARCYSTTDIFAAGFQDHGLGPVLGVDGNTGAGGANVFTYGLLTSVLAAAGRPIEPLPKGVDMRFAIRRTTRVGANAGVPLEDLGVEPDAMHRMTRNDLLNDNGDLIAAAAALLA